jgi:hypothetical protein
MGPMRFSRCKTHGGCRNFPAGRFGEDYRLYVVVNCKTNRQLFLIQDPASKLNPKEEVTVVRYMVGLGDWKKAADAGYGKPGE